MLEKNDVVKHPGVSEQLYVVENVKNVRRVNVQQPDVAKNPDVSDLQKNDDEEDGVRLDGKLAVAKNEKRVY
jgi:hypothetical protein